MCCYFSGKICQKEPFFIMLLFVVAKNILVVVLFQTHTAFLFIWQVLLFSQFEPKQMCTNNTSHRQQMD
jgi:hypothetical protein